MIVAAPERERPRRSAEAIKNGKLRHRSLWLAIRKALTLGSDCCKVSFLCNFGFRVGLLHFFTHWNLSSSGKISPELRAGSSNTWEELQLPPSSPSWR